MSTRKTSPPRRRPEFRFEIKGGKLTLQTTVDPTRIWKVISVILVIALIIVAILRPEGWLDILRAIILLLQPALAGARAD